MKKGISYHTPAPWSINEWTQSGAIISIGAAGTPRICEVILRDVSMNEQKANAKIIAAAPELLDRLKAALAAIPYGNEALVISIENVIKKATELNYTDIECSTIPVPGEKEIDHAQQRRDFYNDTQDADNENEQLFN